MKVLLYILHKIFSKRGDYNPLNQDIHILRGATSLLQSLKKSVTVISGYPESEEESDAVGLQTYQTWERYCGNINNQYDKAFMISPSCRTLSSE